MKIWRSAKTKAWTHVIVVLRKTGRKLGFRGTLLYMSHVATHPANLK